MLRLSEFLVLILTTCIISIYSSSLVTKVASGKIINNSLLSGYFNVFNILARCIDNPALLELLESNVPEIISVKQSVSSLSKIDKKSSLDGPAQSTTPKHLFGITSKYLFNAVFVISLESISSVLSLRKSISITVFLGWFDISVTLSRLTVGFKATLQKFR